MSKVKVNDIEMYYEVHGEGTPLLMLHGFGGASQQWIPYIDDYKQHFQLIIPDYRGHGRTNNPSNVFTHRQASQDMFAFLDKLEINTVSGIGCSSGGDILLHMATKQPKRIKRMVLDGAAPYYNLQTRHAFKEFTPTEEHWELWRQIHIIGDEQINMLINQMIGMKDSYDDTNFSKQLLATIEAKTLILYGDRDKYLSVDLALELYESIPDSYLWIIPNGVHAQTYRNVDQVKGSILDFLTGKWEGS
jgi:pimeloyl-ACP methyl ester carboxylesterase